MRPDLTTQQQDAALRATAPAAHDLLLERLARAVVATRDLEAVYRQRLALALDGRAGQYYSCSQRETNEAAAMLERLLLDYARWGIPAGQAPLRTIEAGWLPLGAAEGTVDHD